MINDLHKLVVRPALELMGDKYCGINAERLLLGTAITESGLRHLKQINGPAMGFYQIEPGTANDIWENHILYRDDLADRVRWACGELPDRASQLATNLVYATMIARLKYWMAPEPMPSTLDGFAQYWKRYYNTYDGKGRVEDFVSKAAVIMELE